MTRFIDLSHVFEDGMPGIRLRAGEAAGDRPFRFFAVPIRAKGAGSMPVRAFAEVTES